MEPVSFGARTQSSRAPFFPGGTSHLHVNTHFLPPNAITPVAASSPQCRGRYIHTHVRRLRCLSTLLLPMHPSGSERAPGLQLLVHCKFARWVTNSRPRSLVFKFSFTLIRRKSYYFVNLMYIVHKLRGPKALVRTKVLLVNLLCFYLDWLKLPNPDPASECCWGQGVRGEALFFLSLMYPLSSGSFHQTHTDQINPFCVCAPIEISLHIVIMQKTDLFVCTTMKKSSLLSNGEDS